MFKRGRHGHLTLRQLETFEAIARLGSVTRAAEALHLTQPAVSLQLRSLSAAVGQRLTEPAGRGLRLTQAGHDLYEACSEMAAVWSRFESQLDEVAALRRGRLRLSVVTTAKYFLPRALGRFVQQHPGIDVELEILNRDGVLARLRDRLDDLHVMSAPPLEWAIDAEPFLDNPLVVIAPRGYGPPKAAGLRLADLAAERFLLREAGSGTRMQVDAALARERVRLARRMTVGSNEAIKQAVAGGLGIAVLSRHALSEADLPEIRVLPVRGFPLAGAWQLVHWHDAHLSAPAEAFRSYLLQFAAELRGGADDPVRRGVRAPRSPRAG
jgi:DNA-binding transcriptional LysR family regulator